MNKKNYILATGGSGLLGSNLKTILINADFPSSKTFDVTSFSKMDKYIRKKKFYKVVLHMAAFTSPPEVKKNPVKAIDVNIIGTANVVKICSKYKLKLIYISTDYVFSGSKGNYSETDPLYPVNKYAWSKLGGECAVRLLENYLIIRTSFGPDKFAYKKAFTDQFTSRERVSKIARKIAKIISLDVKGVIHIGGTRKTVFQYAKYDCHKKSVGLISIKDVDFNVPKDTSLNTTKFSQIVEKIEKEEKI